MSPSYILEQASVKGLNMISITDHNAIQHSLLACKISQGENIKVIPGIELTSREEVHILAYFNNISALAELGKLSDSLLPNIKNKPEYFGYQVIYNSRGEIIELDYQLRQVAINISLDQLVVTIHRLGGLAIPAHIDRSKFSVISQLGFLDEGADFDAVEVSKYKWNKEKYQLGDTISGFPVICGSDSHYPDDIGLFYMETENDQLMDYFFLKKYLIESRNENDRRSFV